ncbi:hypothetical protein [Shewanella sp. YLB-07]|uniref:hypothetical protein n=1 Tax=Shewanella sp. YLB-07 TaxID=2601268 RepID=UPI00128CFBBC|nr:hypothetical protein [Shewanella sp. YLB-07]MPY21573.1 hypothetical protein [Shewanella sp. YLB-07]
MNKKTIYSLAENNEDSINNIWLRKTLGENVTGSHFFSDLIPDLDVLATSDKLSSRQKETLKTWLNEYKNDFGVDKKILEQMLNDLPELVGSYDMNLLVFDHKSGVITTFQELISSESLRSSFQRGYLYEKGEQFDKKLLLSLVQKYTKYKEEQKHEDYLWLRAIIKEHSKTSSSKDTFVALNALATSEELPSKQKEALKTWLNEYKNNFGIDKKVLEKTLNDFPQFTDSYGMNLLMFDERSNIVVTTFQEIISSISLRLSFQRGYLYETTGASFDKNTLVRLVQKYEDAIDIKQRATIEKTLTDVGINARYDDILEIYDGNITIAATFQTLFYFLSKESFVSLLNKYKNHQSMIYDIQREFKLGVSKLGEATPLYFHPESSYQDVYEARYERLAISSKERIEEVEAELRHLSTLLQSSPREPENNYLSAYTRARIHNIATANNGIDAYLFKGLDINSFFNSYLIYTYIDKDRTERNIISVNDYLGSIATQHSITTRKNVNVLWPKEIKPPLQVFLEEEKVNIAEFPKFMDKWRKVESQKSSLSTNIPSPRKAFQNTLNDLASGHNLFDEVLVEYRAKVDDMNLQAGISILSPTQEKTFTIADILMGKEREWRALNLGYRERDSKVLSSNISSELFQELKNVDMQNSYITQLTEIKNNGQFKQKFYSYASSVIELHGLNKNQHYSIQNAPMLLIFPDSKGGQRLASTYSVGLSPEHSPIKVVSLATNQAYSFPSINDFIDTTKKEGQLRDWVSMHFPLDSDANYDDMASTLSMGAGDYSYLFEGIIDQYAKNMDILIRSHSEANALKFFEVLEATSIFLLVPTLAMSPFAGFVYGSALVAAPHLGRAAISDTQDERDNHLKNAGIAVAIEAAFEGGAYLAGKGLGRIIGDLTTPVKISADGADSLARTRKGTFEVSSNEGINWHHGNNKEYIAWRHKIEMEPRTVELSIIGDGDGHLLTAPSTTSQLVPPRKVKGFFTYLWNIRELDLIAKETANQLRLLSFSAKKISGYTALNITREISVSGVNYAMGIVPGIPGVHSIIAGTPGSLSGGLGNLMIKKTLKADLSFQIKKGSSIISSSKDMARDLTFAGGTSHSFPMAPTDAVRAVASRNFVIENIDNATARIYKKDAVARNILEQLPSARLFVKNKAMKARAAVLSMPSNDSRMTRLQEVKVRERVALVNINNLEDKAQQLAYPIKYLNDKGIVPGPKGDTLSAVLRDKPKPTGGHYPYIDDAP